MSEVLVLPPAKELALCHVDSTEEFVPDVEPCGRESVIVLLMGCLHEHIGLTPVCQFHVQAAALGEMVCPNCTCHVCPLVAVAEVTASGEQVPIR
ncbi:hypothetical protein ACIBH1_45345 [Nonomuraea sp. NPDC050663]|uniref:hypothetical protein n=1 Tax=Nonomuraea sp. NPDC050663 TaxID=3364370 RepID=UPI003788BAB7